jgi:hypothetical protein
VVWGEGGEGFISVGRDWEVGASSGVVKGRYFGVEVSSIIDSTKLPPRLAAALGFSDAPVYMCIHNIYI